MNAGGAAAGKDMIIIRVTADVMDRCIRLHHGLDGLMEECDCGGGFFPAGLELLAYDAFKFIQDAGAEEEIKAALACAGEKLGTDSIRQKGGQQNIGIE